LNAIPLISEDGTYPITPFREEALSQEGILILVFQIESAGIIDQTPKGEVAHDILIPILLEENTLVNRETHHRSPSEHYLEIILKTLIGAQWENEPLSILRPFDPPFHNFGKQNGVQRYLVNLRLLHFI